MDQILFAFDNIHKKDRKQMQSSFFENPNFRYA